MIKLVDKICKWLDEDVNFNFGLFEIETNNYTLTCTVFILLIIDMTAFLLKNI